MIISASRRTDIPCYYSNWFLNRLKAGHLLVRNPMNHSQVSKVIMSPGFVDCIVFWTKNANNIMDKLDYVNQLGYKYGFQYTITPYGKDLEQNLPPKKDIAQNFIQISQKIGKQCMIWRYDPIIITPKYTIDFHTEMFEKMCQLLHNHTHKVIISFVDLYSKISPKINQVTGEEIDLIAKSFSLISKKYNLIIQTCCENYNLTDYSIQKSGCIDLDFAQKICGHNLTVKKAKGQRKECKCIESVDIGVYNTCLNGCVYCYANHNIQSTNNNYVNHNPNGEFLLGESKTNDIIYQRKQKSGKET